jgi:hypothetical protein
MKMPDFEITSTDTRYNITTTDKEFIRLMLSAERMKLAIDTWYDEVFRRHYKHAELSDEQQAMVDEIMKNLDEHFEGVYNEGF